MGMILDFLTIGIAVIALTVALLTHAKVSKREDDRDNLSTACWRSPSLAATAAKASKDDVEMRRERAILQKEYDNFMNYDGDVQTPIDPDTILADSGE